MSNCLTCSDPIAPCACSPGQSCIQSARSCNACAKNICIDDTSSSKSGGGGSNTGATAGGAVGGVLGVAAVLAAVYFLWWKPKGLAASQRRYSKHMSHRQSRLNEKRKTQLNAAAGGAQGDNRVSKRSSVHLHVGDASPEGGATRRNTSPVAARTDPVTGALTSRTSEEDNPFGDQNRSSIGDFSDAVSLHTSEFSFRSSQSTNVIPIAYIPPHSSSLSIADGQRGAFGETGGSSPPPPRSAGIRASIPTSMASRDSLALAGAEIIELNPLPPVLTPDTPAVPHGATANGAPIRPPRSPGLDLQLPKTSPAVSSPLASPNSQRNSTSRPTSGFPFSASASAPGSPAFLTPPNSAGGRGMSVLAEREGRAAQSHLSTITSRSATSTMSYILDPPQIITPVAANGIRRVEFMKGQAAVVKIGTNSPNSATGTETFTSPTSPTSPTSSHNPFDDLAEAKRRSHLESEDVGRSAESRPTSTATDTSRWTVSSLASDGSDAVQFLQGQTVTFTNPNTPLPHPRNSHLPHSISMSSAFDGPLSARSSAAYDTGTQIRALTGGPGGASMSRSSTASGTTDGSHLSLLEGIPFMAPPMPGGGGHSTSSVSLGIPVNVTANLDNSPNSISVSAFPAPPPRSPSPGEALLPSHPPDPSAPPAPSAPFFDDSHSALGQEDEDSLPAPFLPFAGQRPTSTTSATGGPSGSSGKDRVQSQAISVRSGFGSGLSQIPFQLGFPSGFGEDGDGASDRGSMISTGTRDSRFPPSTIEELAEDEGSSRRDSYASEVGGARVVEAVRAPTGSSPLGQGAVMVPSVPATPLSAATTITPMRSAPPAPSAPPAEEENPFADPRASTDSFALAAALSANLDAEVLGK
ncbi:hypothetical protein JCM11641_005870 [Rhodosporidiobolus odoratus]